MSNAPVEETKTVDPSHLEAIHSHNEKHDGALIIEGARDALETEHLMSPLECVKNYPMAIFWCLMVSMCVVMEGTLYGFCVVSGFKLM
jgi:SP family general alpha glucoside:H+ symporter-like MFS transporter